MKFFLLFFLLTITSIGYCQERIPITSVTNDWTLIKSEKGLNFYVKSVHQIVYEGKKPFEYIVAKIENTTDNAASVSFNMATFFKEGCQNCGMNTESYKTIKVLPRTSIEGKHEDGNSSLSVLLNNPNNPLSWHPEAIAIENLIVKF